jgi:ABC-type transporter Mla subunit MlaD
VISRVEADDFFRTFDRETRRDLKATLNDGGAALGSADDDLRLALDHAPSAIDEARAVLEDLGADEQALDTLVRSGDRVVHAVQASDRDVGLLIQDASTSFAALAAESDDMRRALSDAPGTLASARQTLGHAERTLRTTGDLATRLAPGVTQVRSAIPRLTSVLQTVQDVGPDARLTLRTARRAAPDLDALLTRARDLMPTIESVSGEAAEQLACLRPYTPEVAGLATTWSRFLLFEDNQDKHARSNFPAFSFNQTRSSSAEVARQFPYLRYGFPQPPGFNAGQPWFLPECHLGPETVDVNQDPEIGRSEPTG